MSFTTMRTATTLVVKSKLHDGSSADDLRKWVVAVAFGKFVHVDLGVGSLVRFRLAPALGHLGRPQDIRFTQRFASRHHELVKITTAIANSKDGRLKWSVSPSGSQTSSASRNAGKEIDSYGSFVRWLHSMMVRK